MTSYVQIDTKYEIVKKIGSGTYGDVYHVKHDGVDCALKICEMSPNFYIIGSVLKEITNLRKFKHTCIVKVYDVFFGMLGSKKYVCILMELGKRLLDINISKKDIKERESMFTDIIGGLNHIHELGYHHGDLST